MNSNTSDRSNQSCFVLTDVTNQQGKRVFSSISSRHKSKSGIENPENSHLPKRVSLGIENVVKESCNAKSQNVAPGIDSSLKGKIASLRSLYSTSSIQGGTEIDAESSGYENKLEQQHSASTGGGSLLAAADNASQSSVLEVRDTMKESCTSSPSVSESDRSCIKVDNKAQSELQDEMIHVYDAGQSDCTREAVPSQVGDDSNESATISSAIKGTPQVVCPLTTVAEGSRSLELVRCSGLKADDCSSSAASFALLKNCTCSFCMKAAYILSDLYYQDVKGRISVLAKSQKETNTIVKMYCGEDDKYGQGNFNKLPELEVDLTSQWKSLFLHMEAIFVKESSQLENSFVALKDMRESCKMNLEMVNVTSSSDVQQCSSDASNDQKI